MKRWCLVRFDDEGKTVVSPERYWRQKKAVEVADVLNSRGGVVEALANALNGSRWLVVRASMLPMLMEKE